MLASGPAAAQEAVDIFDELVELVEDRFYDPEALGESWEGRVSTAREALGGDGGAGRLGNVIDELLSGLGVSYGALPAG